MNQSVQCNVIYPIQSIHPSTYLPTYLPTYLLACLLYLFTYPPAHLSFRSSIYLSVCLSINPSIHPFVRPSVCLSVCMYVCMYVHLPFYPSICKSVSVCPSILRFIKVFMWTVFCISVTVLLTTYWDVSQVLFIKASAAPNTAGMQIVVLRKQFQYCGSFSTNELKYDKQKQKTEHEQTIVSLCNTIE